MLRIPLCHRPSNKSQSRAPGRAPVIRRSPSRRCNPESDGTNLGLEVESQSFQIAAASNFQDQLHEYEDPFTGSATGGMAAYLWRYGLIDAPQFVAEQGHWMQRPGQAYVEIVGTPHDMTQVIIGGYATRVMMGEMLI